MKNHGRVLYGLVVMFVSLSLMAGCAPQFEEVPPTEPAGSPTGGQSAALEALQIKYSKLTADYADSQRARATLQTQYDQLNVKYNDLSTRYDELNAKYEAATQEKGVVTEKAVEQAIFSLVNQTRRSKGLKDLEWADSIYVWARRHSDDMLAKRKMAFSAYNYRQEVYWATGYSSESKIAEAALLIWQVSPQYAENFINDQLNYGAVGVIKSGEVFFITYFSSPGI